MRIRFSTFLLLHLIVLSVVGQASMLLVDTEDTYDLRKFATIATTESLPLEMNEASLSNVSFGPFDIPSVSLNHRYNLLKIQIQNQGKAPIKLFTSGFFSDKIHVFILDPSSQEYVEQPQKSGYLVPVDERTVRYSQSAITPLIVPAQSKTTFLIVVENHTELGKMMAKASFRMGFIAYKELRYLSLYGIFEFVNIFLFGFVCMLIVYNTSIGLWLRDKNMIYLVFYNICYLLWIAWFGGFFIDSGIIQDLSLERTLRTSIPNVFLILGYTLFCYHFGHFRQQLPRTGFVMLALLTVHTLAGLSATISWESAIAIGQLCSPLIYLSTLIGAFILYRRKQPLSIYLLMGTIIMFVALIVFLSIYNIPEINYLNAHFFTALMIVLEVLIFTLASTNKLWNIEKKTIGLKLEKKYLSQELDFKNRELVSITTQLANQQDQLIKLRELADTNGNDQNHTSLSREINRLIADDQSWNTFKLHFENVHPNFFLNLKERIPTITTNEIRLSAFLKMGLKNKEIASFTNVNVRSVDKAKQRLNRKIKESGITLESLLES